MKTPKRCRHKWIFLGLETYKGKLAGNWYWCYLCGATKHYVSQKDYFGVDSNGVYIRSVGKNEKARLIEEW